MRKKLLAVDGNSILNRAFYGVRPLNTKDGFPTNALFGTVNIIARQTEALRPDFCAVAFDLHAPTFRHQMYAEYKAGRKPMPEELRRQFPVAKEMLAAMGFHVLEKESYEADDILGTLSAMCGEEACDAYLLTGDRDALQLIGAHVHVLLATNAETIDMDESRFLEKYGVPSSAFVDVKALMGDASDHIPGVPGIGEKTALRLIADYKTVDGVYKALPTAPLTPSVRKKLEEGKESAYLSKTLATICRSVPLGVALEDLKNEGIRKNELRDLFLRLEFSAFLKRFSLTETAGNGADPAKTAPNTEEWDLTIRTLSETELLEQLRQTETVAIQLDENGVLFASESTLFRAEIPTETLLKKLPGTTRYVCYDCKKLYKLPGTEPLRALPLYDLMLGAYLVHSDQSDFSLSALISAYLGELPKEEIPTAAYLVRLYPLIQKKLLESGQEELLLTLEIPLAGVLADMETVGFRIDRPGIFSYGEHLSAVAGALEEQIFFHAGDRFNINSPKQLGEVLFEKLKLPHAKKTKTGYSTNAEILEKLRPYHPIIDEILDYRQVTKLKSTYADGLLRVADENGRVHTTFRQTGTATGRLSSTEPNLQNIPVRTELGRELRRYFLPENQDYVLIDADYSQIELRVLANVSGDRNLTEAFLSGADIHTATAATVFGVPAEEVTPEMRKRAKAVNFGILYGIGAFSLSEDIGVSRAQAQDYIDQYLAGYPGIEAYLQKTIREAYENGYVTTLFGRRRYIPELAGTNKMLKKFGERVAMNSPIQGSAADIIKLAMVNVHKKLKECGIPARLILQVHDELLIEAHRSCAGEAERILREEMENAVRYTVPLTVEIHSGDTWYDAK